MSDPQQRVLLEGSLRKLKTMKKKFFVLKSDTLESSARLEYYDSEKKWKAHAQPKRVIPLKSCFNITRRLDTRQKHVIALYTKEECLCVVLDGEEQLARWLGTLLALLHGEAPDAPDADLPHSRQHVWQVNVQKKGLGASRNILGLYNLCLTDKTLSLVKIRPNNNVIPHDMRAADTVEFSLTSIRRCGDSECFFYMEVGRSSVTGAGELWMHTEDSNIAQSMHDTILHAMSNSLNIKDEFGPKKRERSASANEASKPISALAHTGTKSHGLSPSSESTFCGGRSCAGLCINPCESASAAYCAPQDTASVSTLEECKPTEECKPIRDVTQKNVVTSGSQLTGRPPIEDYHALSVVHERTRSLPLTGEENASSVHCMNDTHSFEKKELFHDSQASLERTQAHLVQYNVPHTLAHWKVTQRAVSGASGGARRASTGCRLVKCAPSLPPGWASNCTGRERCDSLPSRQAVVHAGHTVHAAHVRHAPPRAPPTLRPHSMHCRGLSHSPPLSPLSPHSDSAGSSISMDEPDFVHFGIQGEDTPHVLSRLMNSRTPDERVIFEEAADDPSCGYRPEKNFIENLEKMNLNLSDSRAGAMSTDQPSGKVSVPGAGETSSPVSIAGTSPQDSAGYMPMSPASAEPFRIMHSRIGGSSANHSRTSSLAEDTAPLPTRDDGYVDMEPTRESRHAMSPAGSACSVTSGTPSTDLRFSEYHLEKVTSYFTPSEDDEENRRARAYSVGSRPDPVKKVIARHDYSGAAGPETARTRAFSVGSRSRTHKDSRVLNHGTPPHCQLQHLGMGAGTGAGGVSFSAPLLAGAPHFVGTPSRHTYNSSHSSAEPLDNLMEMDFSNRRDSSAKIDSGSTTPVLPQSLSRSSRLSLSVQASDHGVPAHSMARTDGYADMSPIDLGSAGYVEMKPAEPTIELNWTPRLATDVRRVSSAMSPLVVSSDFYPGSDSSDQTSTPDGYVEMSWNNAKGLNNKLHNRNRISSLPIAINSSSPKESKGFSQVALSASPIFNIASSLKGDGDNFENRNRNGTPPKISPGVSPVTPVTPSPFSSLRRRSKKQARRNSKEIITPVGNQSQTIFSLSLNSPGSPMKPFSPRVVCGDSVPNRKCPVDASSGTLKLSHAPNIGLPLTSPIPNVHSIDKSIMNSSDETISDYMEMIPGRLSTVKEINESSLKQSGVDKDMKQLINNATKVSNAHATVELSDYISLNPNATVNKNKNLRLSHQKQTEEMTTRSYVPMETLVTKAKPPNGSQPIAAPKSLTILRKISVPAFSNNACPGRDANSKENQGILSSNPLANKSLMSNPLTKSNINITNINQMQTVRKPILVISQTQPITANFKPISDGEMGIEPKSAKSGSPKPVESVLNRQLAGTPLDNKRKGGRTEGSGCDGYESLSGLNGQCTGKLGSGNNKCRPPSATGETSRPSSVSSELSGDTPVSSRPASVTSEGRALHYASLEHDAPERSPRPPPVPATPAFTYAQIDFVKSEELKNSKNLSAKSKN